MLLRSLGEKTSTAVEVAVEVERLTGLKISDASLPAIVKKLEAKLIAKTMKSQVFRDREAWLDARMGRITGSKLGSLIDKA